MVKTINLGREFAKDLGPRYFALGPHSGEEFRDDVLIPAFKQANTVIVDLDDVEGFSASFLEEAFGGLVREFGLSAVQSKLTVRSVFSQWWVLLIEAWMRDAESDFKNRVQNHRTRGEKLDA